MTRLSQQERLERAKQRDEATRYRREYEFRLIPREEQVLDLYARGYHRREIAQHLRIKPETVSTYARSARWMLGARTLTQAVCEADRRGLLPDRDPPTRTIRPG